MSIYGVPGRPLLPLPRPSGTVLADLATLPPLIRPVVDRWASAVEQRIQDLHRLVDVALSVLVNSSVGFTNVVSLSGSTIPANNFARIEIGLGASTEFTWQFPATEPDTKYGVVISLSGPSTPPTIVKMKSGVTFQFGTVTPPGLKADMVLFR